MKIRSVQRILLAGCLGGLLVSASFAADDFMDRLRENLGDASGSEESAGSEPRSMGAPMAFEELRAEDLRIPDSAADKSALSRDSRIDPSLQALIDASDRKGIGSMGEAAKDLGVPYEDRQVLVRLVAQDSRDRDRLEQEVESMGGEVTAVFEDVVMARLPGGSLKDLSGLETMEYASPQSVYEPSYEGVLNLDYLKDGAAGDEDSAESDQDKGSGSGSKVSEGVASIGVERLHQAGLTGKGVKIGIIDFGFQLYDQLRQQGEVPAPAAVKPFNRSNDMALRTVHGTACAEIIHDMAPDATLYLAAVDGADDQIMGAANWMAEQGVDLISFSGGGHGGPHNGQALLDRFVEQMTKEKGIGWIVAAGNEGDSHWYGKTVDQNGDQLIDVPGAQVDVLLLQAQEPTQMAMLVYWDDWGSNPEVPSSTQDVDAHLYVLKDSGLEYLGGSTKPQNGRGAPWEVISGQLPAGSYVMALHAKRVDRSVGIHVVARGIAMQPINASGSVAIPATSNASLAVGAVDVQNGQGESYSGQGPTDDGRLKPQVVAPDNNSSVAYGQSGGRFPGTSAACPHVSGFAALLKQQEPNLKQPDIYRELMAQVRPMGQPVPNQQFGYGHVDASKVSASGNAAPPPGGTPGSGATEQDLRDYLEGVLKP